MCNLQSLIKVHAFEAGSFVLSACGYMDDGDIPDKLNYTKTGNHINYSWASGGSSIVNPAGRYLSEPNFEKDAILYADCYANQIKAVKAVFDSLGHYSRWDAVRLEVRDEAWNPEVSKGNSSTTQYELPNSELRKISEKYEIDLDRLESLINELNDIREFK